MNPKSTEWLSKWLTGHGFNETSAMYLKLVLLLLALFILCFLINVFVKKSLIRSIEYVIKRTKNAWDDALVKNKVFVINQPQ